MYRRYITLFFITIAIISAIIISGKIISARAVLIDTVKVESTNIESTIVCSGRIVREQEEEDNEKKNYSDSVVYDYSQQVFNQILNNVDLQDLESLIDAKPGEIYVILEAKQNQIDKLKEGQTVTVTGSGIRESGYKGKIIAIDNKAKKIITATGTDTIIQVVAQVDFENDNIRPGYNIKCSVKTSTEKNVVIAPYNTVFADDDGTEYVYKLKEDKALKTYIKTSREFKEGFEVIEGVKSGETLITTPNINDGEKVKIK